MKGRRGFRLLHCVVSFPQGDMRTLRKRAIKIAKRHGICGGLSIFHPFRQDDDRQFVPDGYVHFHLIGLAPGHIDPGALGSDYVFKVIRDAKRGDYRGFKKPKEITACIFYLLTHCGVVGGAHALTWFGALSYNCFSMEAWETHFPEVIAYLQPRGRECPFCGSTETYIIFDWEVEIPEGMWKPPVERAIIDW